MGLFLTQSYNKGKDLVYPHFIYHKKNYKRIKVFCDTPCSVKYWNTELKRIERGDKDYKLKNLTIQSLKSKLEAIIIRYKNNDELLSPPQLRLELEKREKVKVATSYTSLPLLHLVESWEKEYMENRELERTTKSMMKSTSTDIKDYIVEVEKGTNRTLIIDDLDDIFCRNFMNWLFNKPTNKGVGLQPHTVEKRFKSLQTFCIWYSNNSKEYKRIKVPRELSKSTKISDEEPPICFYESELQRIYEFTEFNFLEPKENEDGSLDWVESDKWIQHLTRDSQNREKKNGYVEFIYEETKYGTQTYTSWEVYKDFLIFLCSVGCRFSDAIKIKLGNFKHKKRSENSPIKGGIEGFFEFYQKKNNQISLPRVNEVSFEIYKKYSRGKQYGDYLFPRTKKGNPISDQKFNKHIKSICRTIRLNRKIEVRILGSKGVEVSKEKKQLWEVVTSHIGRKTYIKTLVLDRHFSTQEIMKMTGHKSDRVFHKYYSIEERDLLKKPNSPFLKKQKNFLIEDIIDAEEIEVDLPPPPQEKLTLKEKIIQLKELVEIGELSQKDFDKRKIELISTI